MEQFRLFPPLGVVKERLPDDVLSEAQDLLAEFFTEVVEPSTEEQPNLEGNADE